MVGQHGDGQKGKSQVEDVLDFTDLNKACWKDNYLLPYINLLVDSTVGHQLLSFMDAFSGYNQIRLDEAD